MEVQPVLNGTLSPEVGCFNIFFTPIQRQRQHKPITGIEDVYVNTYGQNFGLLFLTLQKVHPINYKTVKQRHIKSNHHNFLKFL